MADKIYRVNMNDLTSTIEDIPEAWAGMGGRGLTSTIVIIKSSLHRACWPAPLLPTPEGCASAPRVL
jgi:hypothetical protein